MKSTFRSSVVLGALALCTTSVNASHFAFKPTGATGTHQLVGTDEIRLTGGNQDVKVEFRLSDWAPNILRGFQFRIDSATYANGIGGAITANTLACANTPACVAAPLYEPGTRCISSNCNAGFINSTRSDWAFIHAENCGVGVSRDVNLVSPNYLYFAVADADCIFEDGPDPGPGQSRYGGSLVLNVPADARGTYEIRLFETPSESFMIDASLTPHPTHTYGRLKIVMVCQSNVNCDDANACTTDTCSSGVCSNVPNYNTTTHCCNPANGTLAPLNNNECTMNTCNANGSVNLQNKPALTPCGSPTNTECNKPDSCDGNGACLARLEPVTTNCGDPTNTTCNPADKCNGAGSCTTNIAAANTPCGSPADTDCDNPDTCNGLGACLVNQAANNTPCSDGFFCTLNEKCTAGVCGGGTPRDCADLLTCTTDTCNENADVCDHSLDPNRCLIDGVCHLDGAINSANTCEECDPTTNTTDWSVLPNGTECNDGNACTGTGQPGIGVDECTGGACVGVPDPECNDRCDFAVPAVVGQNFSNNSSASADDGEASCQPDSNNDVWFEYIADCNGAVFISTTGSTLAPVNDSVLSVYNECPLLGGTELACDDDSGVGLNAALTFMTTAGTRYIIRIAGFEANVGPIVLNLRPANDCFIDGVCYFAGDQNPENDCQACIPALATTQWSPRSEGASCGNNADTDCDSPDACDGAGVCEVNNKPDNTLCSDEGNVCTKNFCVAGLCTHPPEPAGLACGDPANTDCDNPDTCDGGGTCADNLEAAGFPCGDSSETQCDNPDICDGAAICLENLKPNGTACNDADVCTGTDVCTNGECDGTSILQAPLVEAISGRHLRVTPQPPGSVAPIALYVTSPDYPCLSKYINLSGALVGFNDRVIQLVDDWGTIIVQDPDIIPSTDYVVRAECGSFLSAPGTDQTYLWGDVDGNGMVNVLDIDWSVNRLKELPVPFPDEAFDLDPCVPDGWINIIDVSRVVDALKGLPFPCTPPCH